MLKKITGGQDKCPAATRDERGCLVVATPTCAGRGEKLCPATYDERGCKIAGKCVPFVDTCPKSAWNKYGCSTEPDPVCTAGQISCAGKITKQVSWYMVVGSLIAVC